MIPAPRGYICYRYCCWCLCCCTLHAITDADTTTTSSHCSVCVLSSIVNYQYKRLWMSEQQKQHAFDSSTTRAHTVDRTYILLLYLTQGKKEKIASIVARCRIESKHETHQHIAYRLATTTRTHTSYSYSYLYSHWYSYLYHYVDSQELLNFNNTITTKQRPTSIYPSLATNNEDKKPVHPLCSSSSIINSNAITPLYKDLPFETNLRALYGLEKTKRWYMRYGLLLFLRWFRCDSNNKILYKEVVA